MMTGRLVEFLDLLCQSSSSSSSSSSFFPPLSIIFPLACLQCMHICLATLVQSAHMHTPWYAEKIDFRHGDYANAVW